VNSVCGLLLKDCVGYLDILSGPCSPTFATATGYKCIVPACACVAEFPAVSMVPSHVQQMRLVGTKAMQGYAPSRTGLKPTLRQLMIVILWSALLSAAVRPLLRLGVIGFRVDFDCLMIPLLAGSMPLPLLILLLRLCDTRGPVQDWYRACCTASGSILSGILFLLQDPVCYVLTGKTSLTFPLSPILAAVFFLVGVIQLRSIWPKRCLNCGCRDVISVARPARVLSRRLINTGKDGWCAFCGATYERKGTAAWQLLAPEET
jgi:hypothetical protein